MNVIKRDPTGDIEGLTKSGYTLTAGLIGTVLFFLLCFRTVDAGQVGIVTRFGEVNRTAESGVVLQLPFAEHVEKMDTRTQRDEQLATAATADQQTVNTRVAINFSLSRSKAIDMFKNVGVDYKDKVISNNLQAAYKAVSAQYTAIDLLAKRGEVEAKAKEALIARLSSNKNWDGITIENLSIVDFGFSEAFNTAIEAKQVAQQNAQKAEQDLARIRVEAEQSITRARGEAEAQRLQQETLTPELLQKYALDVQNSIASAAISRWNGVMPTTTAGNGTFFNIPLK